MRVFSGAGGLATEKPGKRPSKYDFALTGQLVEVRRADFPWFGEHEWNRTLRGLRTRAKRRGLRVHVQRLEGGTLAVCAEVRKRTARDADDESAVVQG